MGSPVYYLLVGISELWNKEIPDFRSSVQATAGGFENLQLMATGEIDVGVDGGLQAQAYQGLAPFNQAITNARSLTAIWPLAVQITVRNDSGIKSIPDIRGKSFIVGARASAIETIAQMVFAEYDMDFIQRKDLDPMWIGISEASQNVRDGFAPGAFWSGVPPAHAISDLAHSTSITFLSLDKNVIERITDNYPQYSPFTIEPGTYSRQDYPVQTIAVYNSILVSDNLDEELVYEMTRVIFENLDILASEGPARYLQLETATAGQFLEIHPGALRYYQEQGIL